MKEYRDMVSAIQNYNMAIKKKHPIGTCVFITKGRSRFLADVISHDCGYSSSPRIQVKNRVTGVARWIYFDYETVQFDSRL